MADKAFVDTNILIRMIFTEMNQHEQALTLVTRLIEQGTELWISGQVIREFIVQATHPRTLTKPLTITEIAEEIRQMKTLFKIADETQDVRDNLMRILIQYPTRGKQVHDANIVATMLTKGIEILLTLNVQDFKRYDDRIVILTSTE